MPIKKLETYLIKCGVCDKSEIVQAGEGENPMINHKGLWIVAVETKSEGGEQYVVKYPFCSQKCFQMYRPAPTVLRTDIEAWKR